MWYVVQVRAGREQFVADCCIREAISDEEVFIPKIDYERRTRGNDELITRPMFPGYLFFETKDPEDLFFRLKKVNGMTRILETDGEFTPLSEDEEQLFTKLGGKEHLVTVSTGYKQGNNVVITDGPLKIFDGKILRIDRRKRTAVIEVALMGEVRQIRVGLRVLNGN